MRPAVTWNSSYSKVNESTVPHFCVNEEDLETVLFLFLWSQNRCFIHAENFHRNKLKLSSCVLFGYLRSHCKNAVWCLANRGSWMWNGVPEHPVNFLMVKGKRWKQVTKKRGKNFTVGKVNWSLSTETMHYL